MQDILICPVKEFNGQIVIVRNMEKVKQCQGNGFDYRAFYADDNHPAAMMYMTPNQIRQYLCYSDLFSLYWQLKRKNM